MVAFGNIVYRNITVENAAMGLGDAGDNRQLIDMTIAPSGWSISIGFTERQSDVTVTSYAVCIPKS